MYGYIKVGVLMLVLAYHCSANSNGLNWNVYKSLNYKYIQVEPEYSTYNHTRSLLNFRQTRLSKLLVRRAGDLVSQIATPLFKKVTMKLKNIRKYFAGIESTSQNAVRKYLNVQEMDEAIGYIGKPDHIVFVEGTVKTFAADLDDGTTVIKHTFPNQKSEDFLLSPTDYYKRTDEVDLEESLIRTVDAETDEVLVQLRNVETGKDEWFNKVSFTGYQMCR
jgi:hypothetical protein